MGRLPAGRRLDERANFVPSGRAIESLLTVDYLPYSLEDAELLVEELRSRREHGLPIRL